MSINGAMISGVSGLFANASALATISDNIANVNTVGYKRNQTDFQTLVGGGNYGRSQYNAGGVLASSSQKVTGQGALQRTANATDLGIDGQGFFVATQKPGDLTAADARMFTRAGSFTLDREGNLRNSAGLYLQGWPVAADGTVATDPSDLTRLRTINLAQIGSAAAPTTRAAVSANLNAAQALSPEAGAYDAATNSLAAYDPVTGAGVRPDFEMQVPVIDSQGGRRTLTVSFLRAEDPANPGQALPNRWHAEIRAVPASDVETGAGLANGQLRTGIVAFNPDGTLDTAATTLFGTPFDGALRLGASGGGAPAAGEARWADSLGLGAQTVTLDLGARTGGLTQYAAASAVNSVAVDGSAAGSLAGVEVDAEGFVTAIFDNGVTRRVAQVALATVPNPDGLKALSGNAWLPSSRSGAFSLKAPGSGGAGLISPATLEASTVDLSAEFTGLITTQRAYSASSKIITTADEMLEELIRIKR